MIKFLTCPSEKRVVAFRMRKMDPPKRNTLPVWVIVVTVPRITASRTVPFVPMRYAATMVFPCPGVRACPAP